MSQQRRNEVVLKRLLELNKDDNWDEDIADILESGLEDAAQNDCFGTERQMDPRGDGRNGVFHMRNVEGVDE